jgi:hypothetical protein
LHEYRITVVSMESSTLFNPKPGTSTIWHPGLLPLFPDLSHHGGVDRKLTAYEKDYTTHINTLDG